VNLSQRINICRERKQQAAPWKLESEELLSMEAYVAMQSRGMPVTPAQDAATRSRRRSRQAAILPAHRTTEPVLRAATSNGESASGSTIPQAHASAYPIYRLEWQAMGSLQRRLRNCMSGVRARTTPIRRRRTG
jgi:sulfur-oxidizing protein SoxA